MSLDQFTTVKLAHDVYSKAIFVVQAVADLSTCSLKMVFHLLVITTTSTVVIAALIILAANYWLMTKQVVGFLKSAVRDWALSNL